MAATGKSKKKKKKGRKERNTNRREREYICVCVKPYKKLKLKVYKDTLKIQFLITRIEREKFLFFYFLFFTSHI